jgi:2-dehydropantoate 2-reductase
VKRPNTSKLESRQDKSGKNIVVLGAGVQGTVFGVRLAERHNNVTLIARKDRAQQLRQSGATIQNIETSETTTTFLPVLESLPSSCSADLCLVTVRREQIATVLPDLVRATAIRRIVFLVNHANGSESIFADLGRSRTVIAFPGIAGTGPECGVVRYVEIPRQSTAVESGAQDVVSLFRQADLRVDAISDMDSWLRRHAVFITAIVGALYGNGCDAGRLARNREAVRGFILAVREGWAPLDDTGAPSAPFALRTILCWVPLRFSIEYWCKLLASSRGEIYFAGHARHAPREMASLAADVRTFVSAVQAPELYELLGSIDQWARRGQ